MIHHLIRKIHALSVGEHTACQHGTDGILPLQFLRLQYDKSVIDQNAVAHLQVLDQVLIVHGNPLLIADDILRRQSKGISLRQFNLPVLKGLDPVFRPLGIQHNCNGQIQFFPHPLNQVDFGLMLLMGSVGKI